MTFIDWTLFEMVDEQPSFHPSNLWPSVYIASNAKKKCKLIKKHLGRGNFVLFSNEENIQLFLSLNKIHATKYMQRYILFHSHIISIIFLLFESKSNVTFCHKNFQLPIVSHYHWTRNRKHVTDEIWNPRACKEFLRRLSVIWSSPLSDYHRVVAPNQFAMPAMS